MTAAIVRPQARAVVKRYASRLADSELHHLAVVFAYIAHGRGACLVAPLDYRYWRARIDFIGLSYTLVPAQRRKLAALRRFIDQVDRHLAGDCAEPVGRSWHTGSRGTCACTSRQSQ
jgi:hypothetical protein